MEKFSIVENIGHAEFFKQFMKLEGWLPIEEYFYTNKLCPGALDWVLVLGIEENGYQWLPMVAEYRTCENMDNPEEKQGWYSNDTRLDDCVHILFFRSLPTQSQDYLEEYIQDVMKKTGKMADKDIILSKISKDAEFFQKKYFLKVTNK